MPMNLIKKLPDPDELKAIHPLSEALAKIKRSRDTEIRDIFTGASDKFLVIVGPCSADSEDSVLEYCEKLAALSEKIADRVVVIPRVYTNKPRTTGEGY